MSTGQQLDANHVAVWHDAEDQVRAEIRRIDDVVDQIRAGTANLHWQGPGAGRFRWRTDRRVRELHDQQAMLVMLLSLLRRAADAAPLKPTVEHHSRPKNVVITGHEGAVMEGEG